MCSWLSVQFWGELGAKLVVLAREVSFEELKEIREKCPDIKLEAFIHGAMCMTYSGRCLLVELHDASAARTRAIARIPAGGITSSRCA